MNAAAADAAPPSLRSELRRSLTASNLLTAALPPVALLLIAVLAMPDDPLKAVLPAMLLWFASVILHAGVHAYFGWRYQRGLQSLECGHLQRARKLLAPALTAWGCHYDPAGIARRACHAAAATPGLP